MKERGHKKKGWYRGRNWLGRINDRKKFSNGSKTRIRESEWREIVCKNKGR